MRYTKDVRLLKSLIEIPSPSGFESKLSIFIKKYLQQYLPKTRIEIDFHNNVIVTIPGKSKEVIMIDAHADQLGFLVSNIDKEGLISLLAVGGHDVSILKGRKVSIITDKNKIINGVIGSKPVHLIDDVMKEIPDAESDICVDIGIRKYKTVGKYIKIGDPVVLSPVFSHLLEDYYTGTAFDDKAGCFLLMEAIKQLRRQSKKPFYTLKFVFSSQEELGCKGALEVVNRYKPSLFIGVDVTFATDVDRTKEEEVGRCQLGKGLAIHRGVNIYQPANKLLSSIANRNKIKVQYLATDGCGTNAGHIANKNGGIRVLDLGIPLRYMHTSVEVINLKDVRQGAKLIRLFLLSNKLRRIIEK